MVHPDDAYDYFIATLSNRTRLKILNELLVGDKNVGQLTDVIGVDQSTVSNGLSRLKSCGFVSVVPNGTERIYSINKETIEPLMTLVNKHIGKFCVNCIKRGEKP